MIRIPKLWLVVLLIILCPISCEKDNEAIVKTNLILLPVEYSSMELELFNAINEYRESLGLQILNLNDEVSSVSDTHTRYLSENLLVSHDNFVDRLYYLMQITGVNLVHEIVAYGYSSPETTLNAWINSDSHNTSLIKPELNEIGVSIETDINGHFYYVCILVKT